MNNSHEPAISSNWNRPKNENERESTQPEKQPEANQQDTSKKQRDFPNWDDLPMFLTVKDLQALLRVSHNTVYSLIAGGEIQAKTVGRQFRIPRSELLRYINN